MGSTLRPGEEDWQGVFDKLCERFSSVSPAKVADALRENDGHAGNAAAALREMSSMSVKDPDPDDVEHVATLLSSPAMFKHACKEQFKKFDIDGSGSLDIDETITLTTSLYNSFGLQLPSEGSVRAFFAAMDENGDGVLSESEFRKFFETFLRFAFFDVAKLQELVASGAASIANGPTAQPKPQAVVAPRAPQPAPQPQSVAAQPQSVERSERSERRQSSNAGDRPNRRSHGGETPTGERPERSHRHGSGTPKGSSRHGQDSDRGGHGSHRPRHSRGSGRHPKEATGGGGNGGLSHGTQLRCIASHGVAYRNSADFGDRRELVCQRGEPVKVLEHWVRTSEGWLPLVDSSGASLFQVEESKGPEGPPPADALGDGEEEWQTAWDRLSERFPHVPKETVLAVLRDNGGHAGTSAQTLRNM